MKLLRFVQVVCLAVVVSVPMVWLQDPLVDLVRFVAGSPRDPYAVRLKWGRESGTAEAYAWLHAAEASLSNPARGTQGERVFRFEADAPSAAAVAVALRRGQRYIVESRSDDPAAAPIFIDVLRREGETSASVAYATETGAPIEIEVDSDGEYVVRVQPALHVGAQVALAMKIEPTLRLPVEQATHRSIGSVYGDARDGGRRDHHGVDIFAKRGTPVVAAANGIVTRVATNGLGGKVVWIARPLRGEAHYYAHLDRQLVTVGDRVEKGDVIGLVGNTGNARSAPPHLHFGIYTSDGAVDPLPYIVG